MLVDLSNHPIISLKEIKRIADCLGDVRLVGGCVRDAILGIENSDIDLATPLTPDKVIEKLNSHNIKVVPTGLKFGTVTAVIAGRNYEITTLRHDVACDGRHADVAFTNDYAEDAARRDFTINALSADINGKVYDYHNGIADLQNGVVKFIGNAKDRCEEDFLRILRFFRFYAYYGKGEIDQNSLAACTLYADKIKSLSGERIQKEMLKLFAAKNPLIALTEMLNANLKDIVFSNFECNFSYLRGLIEFENKYSLPVLSLLRIKLFAGIDNKQAILDLKKSWKLSNKDTDFLLNINSGDFPAVNKYKEHNYGIRNLGKDTYKIFTIIHWVKETVENKALATDFLNLISYVDKFVERKFPLSGIDLQKIGFKSGKEMGDILKNLEHLWEENDYQISKQELLKLASTRR